MTHPKPSPRVVEQACQLLSAAASNSAGCSEVHMEFYPSGDGLWTPEAAAVWRLAMRARLAASDSMGGFDSNGDDHYFVSCAEAEAVLRTGEFWQPLTEADVRAALESGRRERVAAERTLKRSPRR